LRYVIILKKIWVKKPDKNKIIDAKMKYIDEMGG